jgi:hypothetical protein
VLFNAGVSALFFLGSVLAFVLPCRPFVKRFQIYPNPGRKSSHILAKLAYQPHIASCTSANEAHWVMTVGDVLYARNQHECVSPYLLTANRTDLIFIIITCTLVRQLSIPLSRYNNLRATCVYGTNGS